MLSLLSLQDLTNYQRSHTFKRLPSLLEFLGYVFCFGNLLAGPVIEFRDYQMWVNSEGLWDPKATKKVPWTGDLKAVSRKLHPLINWGFWVAVVTLNSLRAMGHFLVHYSQKPCCRYRS